MNNSFMKLAVEAGYNRDRWNTTEQFEQFLEQYGKLIVKECANQIEQNRSSGENSDSWTITRDMAFYQMQRDLKEHFGVE